MNEIDFIPRLLCVGRWNQFSGTGTDDDTSIDYTIRGRRRRVQRVQRLSPRGRPPLHAASPSTARYPRLTLTKRQRNKTNSMSTERGEVMADAAAATTQGASERVRGAARWGELSSKKPVKDRWAAVRGLVLVSVEDRWSWSV